MSPDPRDGERAGDQQDPRDGEAVADPRDPRDDDAGAGPRDPRERERAAGPQDAEVPELLEQAFFREGNVADEAAEARRRRAVWPRLLPRAAGILALLVALDLVLRTALPPAELVRSMQGEVAAYTVKVARFARSPAPDVLLLGSSRTRDGMVPAVLADALEERWGRRPRVYNLGLMNAKAEEWFSLVDAHLPDPPPPYVVIGVTGSEIVRVHDFQYAARFLWRAPQFWAYLRRTAWDDLRVRHVEHYLESAVGRLWYLFGQRQAFERLLTRAVRELLGLDAEERRAFRDAVADEVERFVVAPDGYIEPIQPSRTTLAELLADGPDALRIPARELEHPPEIVHGDGLPLLARTVTTLLDRGSRVAIVEMPSSPYLQERNPVLHGGGIAPRGELPGRAGFRQRVAELAERLGVPWVPFPARENFLGNELFVDINHLTPTGARRYTAMLYRKLDACGFFEAEPPPRIGSDGG